MMIPCSDDRYCTFGATIILIGLLLTGIIKYLISYLKYRKYGSHEQAVLRKMKEVKDKVSGIPAYDQIGSGNIGTIPDGRLLQSVDGFALEEVYGCMCSGAINTRSVRNAPRTSVPTVKAPSKARPKPTDRFRRRSV